MTGCHEVVDAFAPEGQGAASGNYCPIPLHADGCVKTWLRAQSPPECVNKYIHDVGVEQADIAKYCR